MLSNFPYYISEKADSEILEFLQNFENPRISNKITKANNKKIEDIKFVEPAELNKGHPDYKEFLKLAYNPYEDK